MLNDVNRAELLMNLHRPKEAIKVVLDVLAIRPDDSHAQAVLARCFVQLNQFRDARRHVEQAVGNNPDYSYAHYVHSFVLRGLKQPELARQAIQEALRLSPATPDYLAQSSSLWMAHGQYREAIGDAERGLHFDPNHLECACYRAFALKCLGKLSLAEQAAKAILAQHPDHSVVHDTYGWIAIEQLDFPVAHRHFLESLRISPDNAWAAAGLRQCINTTEFFRGLEQCDGISIGWIPGMIVLLGCYCFVYSRVLVGKWWDLKIDSQQPHILELLLNLFLQIPCVILMLATLIGRPLASIRLVASREGRHLMETRELVATLTAWGLLLTAAVLMETGYLKCQPVVYFAGCVTLWGSVPATMQWVYRHVAWRRLFTLVTVLYFATGAGYLWTEFQRQLENGSDIPAIEIVHWIFSLCTLLLYWMGRMLDSETGSE